MKRNTLCVLKLSTTALLAFVALPAFACPPGALRVPGPFPTIQAAVDASGPGAVVCVARGTYQENVQVLTSGLTIIGDGASPADVVIEARGPDGACRDSGIFVNAANVRVENLTIQNACRAATTGDNVNATGDGFRFVNSISRAAGEQCLEISGSNAQVTESTFVGCKDTAIIIDGAASATVTGNTIRNGTVGVFIPVAGDSLVSGNKIVNVFGYGISVGGAGTVVSANIIRTTSTDGIVIQADNITIDGNVTDNARNLGIQIDGAAPVVTNNRVRNAGKGGVRVNCTAFCNLGRITGNNVSHSAGGSPGIEATAVGPGFEVASNTVASHIGRGFALEMGGATIQANIAAQTGASDSMEGIRVTGNENAIASNVARSGGGSGFVVNGNGNVMTANEARNNAKDGFTIESGAGNQWLDSSSTSNGGEGFDNKGANTTVSNVTSNKNRIDCASDGSLGSATGLHCADGSDFGVASEIN